MRCLFSLVVCFIAHHFVAAQQVIPLHLHTIPNSIEAANEETSRIAEEGRTIISKISVPTLTIFLPPKNKANGTAIIICPGGGYYVNAFSHEGTDVAKKLNESGIAAFVLKYRLPDESIMINTSIGPLQDVEQAMLMVRSRATEWNIDPHNIGVMGFSAGGHLAATLGTQYKNVVIDNPGKIDLRPDFLALIYPLITADTAINSPGVMQKLLGKNAPKELKQQFSTELQVNAQTPPTFISQASNDNLSVRNSILFYEALIKNKVPAEMHLYEGGGHGYGLNNKTTQDSWLERCVHWLEARFHQ